MSWTFDGSDGLDDVAVLDDPQAGTNAGGTNAAETNATTAQAAAGKSSSELERLRGKLADYEGWFRTLDNHIRDLEGERQKFAALVNYTDAGIVLLDPDLRVVWTNTVYRERFARKTSAGDDPFGLSCSALLCGKSSTCDDCPARKLFETGKVAHHEVSLFLGSKFHHVYATAIPVHSLDGKLDQTIVMLQDLSDLQVLRKSEEALRTTEQRFRSIFEQAGAGMVTVRGDGTFLQVNPTYCKMLGYTESELLRKKITELTHIDDCVTMQKNLERVRREGVRTIEMERRYLRRDGTVGWCQSTAVWQFDAENRPTHAVELIQDISERKRAEQALADSQTRYEALVHSIDGIVWEANPRAFRFSFISKQAERILGFPVERWLAQPRFWRNQIDPADLERVLASLTRVVMEKRGCEVEYRMISADRQVVWIRDTVSPVVENSRVKKLRGLMVDITAKKKAEEALRKSEEQLRQSQKMEAIGRLAGGIAHDFNNLLTAMTGYGDFLIRGLVDHPLQREAKEVYRAAQRAAELTGQLLAFSRQQVMQPRVLDLHEVAQDMDMMLRRLIGEHVELSTVVSEECGPIKADPGQIQQVIMNLVVNARDAMPDGGRITLRAEDVDLNQADVSGRPGLNPGPYVKISVDDEGCGMDEETKSRLFEPFFTTKEQGKGTGLGLSTVYGIVRQSGGHILVVSESGEGASFQVFLPRAERGVAPLPQRKVPAGEMIQGTETILLVEDDEAVRDLAREILEMNGYFVIEASNGMDALSIFEAEHEAIELMVTDLVMPQLGGRDLARRVAASHPDLPVLYLSGYTDSVVLQQGLLDPGSSFLQKPFTPDDLARKVRQALDEP